MNSSMFIRKVRKCAVHANQRNVNNKNSICSQGSFNQKLISNSWRPFFFFLKSFEIFGLYILQSKETDGIFKKILKFLHLTVVFLSLHYWVFLYVSYFIRDEGNWKMFNTTLVLFTSTATYDIILFQKQKIKKLVRIFNSDKTFNAVHNSKKHFLKRVITLNALIWIVVLLVVATFLGIPSTKEPEDYFTQVFYEHVVNRTSQQFGKFLIQINNAYFCFLVEGTLTVTVGFFVASVYACGLCFKNMGDDMKHLVPFKTLTALELKKIQRLYDNIMHRVDLIEGAFSLAVLLWYFMVVLTLCIRVMAILGDSGKATDLQGMVIIGFGILRGVVLIMITLPFTAQYMTDSALNALIEVETSSAVLQECAAYQELAILMRRVELKAPHVTLWRFCSIGRPFLMSCVSTIVTYIIISLQLTPVGKHVLHI